MMKKLNKQAAFAAFLSAVLLMGTVAGCAEKKFVLPNSSTRIPAETSAKLKAEPKEITFRDFSGDYYFSSGAGGWSTDVTIKEDGSFTGVFHDSDMGVNDPAYPNGTVYFCEFSGKFSALEKKDDLTYTCSLEEISQKEETGKEMIRQEEGIKYIYSDPYGFEEAKDFAFYLPGKSVADCDPEFLSWMSLRYNDPYPDTLFCRAFQNLSKRYGFEEAIDDSQDVKAEYPESLPLDAAELDGSYFNQSLGVTMSIVYTGGEKSYGSIFWCIPDDSNIWNDPAIFLPSDNGFDAKTKYGEYKIIVTDHTSQRVVLHLYDDKGRDCGEYVMIDD